MPKFLKTCRANIVSTGGVPYSHDVVLEADIPVTAEQHALDNPGHVVTVVARHTDLSAGLALQLRCISCDWCPKHVDFND